MGVFERHGGPLLRTAISVYSPAERADLREIKDVNDIEGRLVAHEFVSPDNHQIKLASELNDLQMLESSDGQTFSALWLNRDSENASAPKPLLLMGNGFLASVGDTDSKYRAYHLAREFPEYQIITFDQPGHGFSSPFTEKQREHMSGGDMSDVGQQQYDAIRRFIKTNVSTSVPETIARAESFAGRGMLDVAEASQNTELAISKLVLFELPGTENARRFDIHASFFGYEWLRSSYYSAGSEWWDKHKKSFEDFITHYSGEPLADKPASFFANDRKMMWANFRNTVLGHGNGLEVLRKLVLEDVKTVRISAEKSRIDRLSAAEAQRRDMLQSLNRAWGQIRLAHESHDGTGFAPRARIAARLSRFALDYAVDLAALNDSYPVTMRRVQQGDLMIPQEISL